MPPSSRPQSHSILKKFNLRGLDKNKTEVAWATNPCRRAIVFVHGFRGDSTGTWRDFPTRFLSHPDVAGHDLFFFGYASAARPAAFSGSQLYKLARRLLTARGQPPSVVLQRSNESRDAPHPPTYDRITFVAHSLGAVITRTTLLQLSGEIENIGERVRMVLFAPAHRGANILRLIGEAAFTVRIPILPAAASTFLLGAHAFWKVLPDLEVGSDHLTQLAADTDAALNELAPGQARGHLVAGCVIHGGRDFVVVQEPFCNDPVPEPIPDATHISICKPNDDYLDPIHLVLPHI